MTSRKCAGCMACGGSGHSHRSCVLLGAALHRKLDPHKDMKDVVDVILRLLLWDWRETGVDEEIHCLSYAPSCDIIAAGSESGKIFLINAQTGEKIVCPVNGHSNRVSGLAFKPDDSNVLVTGSWDRTCKVWDLSTGACLSMLNVDAGAFGVQCFTFNGTGDTIVAGCYNGNIFFIDTATYQVREQPLCCGSPVNSLAYKDNMIAAGCGNGIIKLFALKQSGAWVEIQSESPMSCGIRVNSITFQDKTIAVGCGGFWSGEIKIFALNESGDWGEIRSEPPMRCDSPVWCIAFKDNMIVAGCDDGKIKLFAMKQSGDWGEIQSESPPTWHSSAVTGVVFSADEKWLLSGGKDRTIRLWNARRGSTASKAV